MTSAPLCPAAQHWCGFVPDRLGSRTGLNFLFGLKPEDAAKSTRDRPLATLASRELGVLRHLVTEARGPTGGQWDALAGWRSRPTAEKYANSNSDFLKMKIIFLRG